MFTVMIWMRDIFGKCPLSGFAGRMRQQCKSQDLHIGRALWCHQVDFAELLSTLAATWTNLWMYWIILVQTRKSGLYYDVANQCTQLVVSSFFIGWKYWASNPSACSEDICQVFLKKQRICWMLPPFLWVQLVPGRRPSCATLPWTWHRGFRCHELDMLLYYTHILYSCMFIQPTRILQVYAPKILWKLWLQVLVVDFLGHLADLHLHHSDLAYVASCGVASQVQRLREAIDDHLPEVDGGGVWDRFEASFSTAKARGFLPFVSPFVPFSGHYCRVLWYIWSFASRASMRRSRCSVALFCTEQAVLRGGGLCACL